METLLTNDAGCFLRTTLSNFVVAHDV